MKTKKTFYKKPPFIIIAAIIVIFLVVALLPGKDKETSEKIDWSKMELGSQLPEPSSSKGKIWTNTTENLNIDLNKVSDDEYSDYVTACEQKGYTIDSDKSDFSFDAYNKEGYQLSITHINDGMDIKLNSPIKLDSIQWPSSTAGSLLPAPKSLKGKFNYEHDSSFSVAIGETTPDDYTEYVQKVQDSGFKVDYDKRDNYYSAYNNDSYHVCVEYKGFNTMNIQIDSPSDSDDSTLDSEKGSDASASDSDSSTNATKSENDSASGNSKKNKSKKTKGLRSDFKKAMDSYEAFMDEYIKFMTNYDESDTSAKMLKKYTNYLQKYGEFVDAFDKWESKDLNTAEAAYYAKVEARVTKKLTKAAIAQ